MLEQFFQCPYCWEEVSIILDSSTLSFNYIEDCEVCCNPIEVTGEFNNNEIIRFIVKSIEQ